MKVKIKEWGINPEIMTKGMELEIRTPDGKTQIGDIFITKSSLIWCEGKTTKNNGIKVTWDKLIKNIGILND